MAIDLEKKIINAVSELKNYNIKKSPFTYVWDQNIVIKERDELLRTEATLQSQNRLIRSEIAHLSRADRIKEIASTKLSMVTPVPETLAVIIDFSFEDSYIENRSD